MCMFLISWNMHLEFCDRREKGVVFFVVLSVVLAEIEAALV